jgi:hypothetical protein
MVAITVVLAGILYVWVTSLADTDADEMDLLDFDASLSLETRNLTLEMTHGDGVKWQAYRLQLDGVKIDVGNGTMGVGDVLDIPIGEEYGLNLTVGRWYDLAIINLVKQRISWKDDVVCVG